ncbi:MAG: hypothetical protein IJM88_01975 [Bacteroidales bacterium]|nr:hypothetical protein [Bacteroidales bacterium]
MKKIVFIIIMATIANSGVNAQEVITLSQGHNVKTEKVTPLYRPTGNDIRIAIGGPVLIGIEYNRWIKPWLMVGAGTGYGMVRCIETVKVPAYTSYYGYYYPVRDESIPRAGYGIPLYVEAELRTPKYKWSAFLNVKMGYGVKLKRYGTNEEGSFYCGNDDNNNPVYGEVNYEWKPFFMLATAGFSYKRFSMGIGAGILGISRCASLLISYDIPLN